MNMLKRTGTRHQIYPENKGGGKQGIRRAYRKVATQGGHGCECLEAMLAYKDAKQFFTSDVGDDKSYEKANGTLLMAKATSVAGYLTYHLDSSETRKEKRKMCKEQLAIKDRLHLTLPPALLERATRAVTMTL